MLLKSLRMRNFRQYKGTQSIAFATDPEKNVTVILGDNTYGKTTLLQAFNWCMYESVLLDNPEDMLNYDIAESMPNGETEEVEVEIALVHGGHDYTITRTQVYTKIGTTAKGAKPTVKVCWTRDDGQTENVKSARVDGVIKSILPEDLSSYFFFDTERVATVSMRKDLTESVKGLLGLSVLDNAIKHLGTKSHKRSVLGQLHASLDKDGDARAADALAKMQDARDRREDIKERLEECDSQIAQLSARKTQLDEILSTSAKTKDLQAKKLELEKRVAADSASLERTIKALRSDFSKSSISYFVVPLIDEAEEVLKDAKLDDKGIKDLTRPTLEDILARGTCVCGQKFDEHPEAIAHIKEEMRYCPPESIGNAVRNYRDKLKHYRGDQSQILEGMADRRANIYSTTDRIQNTNDEIDALSEDIAQSDVERIAMLERERNDIKAQLKTAKAKRDSLIRDDEKLKNEIERNQKIYDNFSVASSKNKQLIRYIRYADEIYAWLTETYQEKEIEVRDSLEERVNAIFEQMYHGSRKVIIDSRYEVKLLTSLASTDKYTGESEGLNRVKNFAFIAGLVSLAKDKIVSSTGDKDYDLSSEPYPLVMDAPFSNTDETHIANISRVLPEASEQVIMFVMRKDWRYAEPVLGAKVGAHYELDKRSEQHSVLKEI